MTNIQALTRPVSPDAPCGPDLEAVGDLDYMNLMARVEGDLPASFFTFDRAEIDFGADMAALMALLERSRDLRPVAMLAKLTVLNRDLAGFARWLELAQTLLAEHWEALHPAAENGSMTLRGAVLQTLDDMPTVVLPLQYAPLFASRRFGPISFRHHLVASGEVARREGEAEVDATGIAQALSVADIDELRAQRDHLKRIADAVEAMRRTWIDNNAFDDAPTLDRLGKLSGRMVVFLDAELERRDPAAALESSAEKAAPEHRGMAAPDPAPATGSSTAADQIDSARAASRAFDAAIGYLLAAEPSNPALLLIHQAQQLVGRSFVEIMQALMPDDISDAKITIGSDQRIVFRLTRLTDVVAPADEAGSDEHEGATAVVRSRRDVQQLLEQIAAFYRRAEPSNPIPLLCDRARNLCVLDFNALIRDMMPPS